MQSAWSKIWGSVSLLSSDVMPTTKLGTCTPFLVGLPVVFFKATIRRVCDRVARHVRTVHTHTRTMSHEFGCSLPVGPSRQDAAETCEYVHRPDEARVVGRRGSVHSRTRTEAKRSLGRIKRAIGLHVASPRLSSIFHFARPRLPHGRAIGGGCGGDAPLEAMELWVTVLADRHRRLVQVRLGGTVEEQDGVCGDGCLRRVEGGRPLRFLFACTRTKAKNSTMLRSRACWSGKAFSTFPCKATPKPR